MTKKLNDYIKQKLDILTPIFAKATIGDFSQDVQIPDNEDEFTQLYVGIQIMLEVVREQINAAYTQHARTEAIITSIGDGVLVVDLECRIVLMNAKAEELCGYSQREAQGKHYTDIFRFRREDSTGKPAPPFIEEVIQKGEATSWCKPLVLLNRDNAEIAVSSITTQLKNEQGNVTGYVVLIRDFQRERELEQTKDEFLSIAAHQLRTPLGTIRWSLEKLLENKRNRLPDNGLYQKLNDIAVSNRRMILLVNDLLSVSRIEQGRTLNEPKHIDFSDMIATIVRDMEIEAKLKSLTISVKAQKRIPTLFVDPKRCTVIVQNLLSNAIKYNVTGGSVRIILSADTHEIFVRVEDTGIGIPREDQHHIFTKFFRAKNAILSQTTGSGLGLFIVKSYIEDWGGKVWFISPTRQSKTPSDKTPEGGTRVSFTIPIMGKMA